MMREAFGRLSTDLARQRHQGCPVLLAACRKHEEQKTATAQTGHFVQAASYDILHSQITHRQQNNFSSTQHSTAVLFRHLKIYFPKHAIFQWHLVHISFPIKPGYIQLSVAINQWRSVSVSSVRWSAQGTEKMLLHIHMFSTAEEMQSMIGNKNSVTNSTSLHAVDALPPQ